MADPNAQQVANYVAEHVAELARMSRDVGLDVLAYLLDLARMEAAKQSERE